MNAIFTKSFFVTIFSLLSLSSSATKITANIGGGNWNAPGTWDLGRVPDCGDTIVVPVGVTVMIPANVNLNVIGCAPVTIQVAGSLSFSNGRKIRLNAGGCVQVAVTGTLVPSGVGGGTSEVVEIDNQEWWKAADGTLFGSATVNGVSLGCGVGLPVELSEFSIEYINESAELSFTTKSERELTSFIIEVSRDASYWQEIATVETTGNSNAEKNYKVKDEKPFIGISYYKLSEVLVSGQKIQIGLITGEYNTSKYLLYPIPVNKTMFVEGEKLEESNLTVVNSVGENIPVESVLLGDKVSYNFSDIKSGVYFLIIDNGVTKKTERIVVVHK